MKLSTTFCWSSVSDSKIWRLMYTTPANIVFLLKMRRYWVVVGIAIWSTIQQITCSFFDTLDFFRYPRLFWLPSTFLVTLDFFGYPRLFWLPSTFLVPSTLYPRPRHTRPSTKTLDPRLLDTLGETERNLKTGLSEHLNPHKSAIAQHLNDCKNVAFLQ